MLILLATLAFADDEEDEFGFLNEGDEAAAAAKAAAINADDFSLEEEDDDFGDWEEAPPPEERDPGPADIGERSNPRVGTNKATALPYSVVGKTPLADNYEASIVFADRDAVVLELPVLLARNPGDYEGRTYWLCAEVYADGMKVAESRQQVNKAAIAQAGPTIAFVKMLVPVPDATGTLEVKVGTATASGGTSTPLFSRQVGYQL